MLNEKERLKRNNDDDVDCGSLEERNVVFSKFCGASEHIYELLECLIRNFQATFI